VTATAGTSQRRVELCSTPARVSRKGVVAAASPDASGDSGRTRGCAWAESGLTLAPAGPGRARLARPGGSTEDTVYGAGQVAGYEDFFAEDLVDAGFCVNSPVFASTVACIVCD